MEIMTSPSALIAIYKEYLEQNARLSAVQGSKPPKVAMHGCVTVMVNGVTKTSKSHAMVSNWSYKLLKCFRFPNILTYPRTYP